MVLSLEFVEAIQVELANEAGKIAVLVQRRQDCLAEFQWIMNYERPPPVAPSRVWAIRVDDVVKLFLEQSLLAQARVSGTYNK